MNPEIAHSKGQSRMTPKGRPLSGVYEENYYSFHFQTEADENLPDALARHTDVLALHKKVLDDVVQSGGQVEYFIGWFNNSNSGATINYKVLSKIAALKINISFDVYDSLIA